MINLSLIIKTFSFIYRRLL